MIAAGSIGTGPALARGYFVRPSGNDSNAGTIGQPWRGVNPSLAKLRAGDTLYVRAGQYFESPTASVSGSASAPIVVRSYPGELVTLDSGFSEFQTPGNSEWELVNAATGEYRSKRTTYADDNVLYGYVVPQQPYENGRVALVPYQAASHFQSTSEQYDPLGSFYVGPGTYAPADGRIYIRLAKTSDLRATEARYGTVFSGELPNPAQYSIVLSRAGSTLRVTGSYLQFIGLVLHPASNTIELGANAHDVRFEDITAWAGDRAIEAEETGVHHITVTRSRLYGDDPYWVFWSDMKDAPYPADKLRATTIDLRAGTHDWEISYCHIRGSGQDLIGTTDAEYNIAIHHNRLENAGDDALELEGSLGRVDVYENFFLNNLVAVASGQASPGFAGPLYVYRNVMASLRKPAVNREAGINEWNGGARYGHEYMLKENASDNSTRDAHYYHNTMLILNSNGKGMNLTAKYPDGTRTANNLLVTVNGPVNGAYLIGSDQVVDGDLYWRMNTQDATHLTWSYDNVAALSAAHGLEAHGVGSTPRRGTDPRFANLPVQVVDRTLALWEITAASEKVLPVHFFLGSASPARGAGIVIPPHAVHGPLPDSRSSRDIGAIPYGTPNSEYDGFPFNPALGAPVPVVPTAAGSSRLQARIAPHPMRSHARLHFTLAREGPTRIELFDLQGRLVRTLLDVPWLAAGSHSIALERGRGPESLSAGVYLYRLKTGEESATGKLVIER